MFAVFQRRGASLGGLLVISVAATWAVSPALANKVKRIVVPHPDGHELKPVPSRYQGKSAKADELAADLWRAHGQSGTLTLSSKDRTLRAVVVEPVPGGKAITVKQKKKLGQTTVSSKRHYMPWLSNTVRLLGTVDTFPNGTERYAFRHADTVDTVDTVKKRPLDTTGLVAKVRWQQERTEGGSFGEKLVQSLILEETRPPAGHQLSALLQGAGLGKLVSITKDGAEYVPAFFEVGYFSGEIKPGLLAVKLGYRRKNSGSADDNFNTPAVLIPEDAPEYKQLQQYIPAKKQWYQPNRTYIPEVGAYIN